MVCPPTVRARVVVAACWFAIGTIGAIGMGAAEARAASSNPTTTTSLLRANGSGEQLASGDWVTIRAAPGLDNAYRFFVEVPPGTPRLVVEIFDADVGAGGNNEGTRDLLTGGSFNTGVIYSLINPNGTTVSTVTCNATVGTAPCLDNRWSSVFGTQNNPIAGHWQIVVDPSDANGQNGDETMGFGVRAHDGDPSAGGQELNVYADSYLGLGPTTATTQTNTFFPWVTAGCFARSNDFDSDTSAGTSYSLVGNVGFSQTFTTVSASGVWLVNPTSQFTTDASAQNYGVWTATATITRQAGAAANMVTYYVSSPFGTAAGTGNPEAPRSQPGEAGAFRLYLPQDSGAAPVKPFVEQFVRVVDQPGSGPNPLQPGQTTTLAVTLAVRNPTARPIVFSATHLVTSTIPAGVVYAGNAQVAQGTITAQPAVGGTGTFSWNPGTIAAGAQAIATYQVNVTPTSSGQRILVTGQGTATGTTATYVDETGNTAQARATYAFGPLCELAVTAGVVTAASVVDVDIAREGGPVRVSWAARGEAGTIAYTVERDGAVVGSAVATMNGAGGDYAIVDADAALIDDDDAIAYRIVEHTVAGAANAHGPYTLATTQHAHLPAPDDAQATTTPPMHAFANAPTRTATTSTLTAIAHPPARLRIRVDDDGLVAVPLVQIAGLLQTPLARVRAAALSHALLLEHDGDVASWDFVDDAIVFAGARESRPFGAHGFFFLSIGQPSNDAVRTISGAPTIAAVATTTGQATEHFEEDNEEVPTLDIDPFGDLWFWAPIFFGFDAPNTFTTQLSVPDDAGHASTISVALQGATSTPSDDHAARISVNGAPLGDVVFDGLRRGVATFALPAGALDAGGALDVTIEATGAAAAQDVFFLDSIEVAHTRTLDAREPIGVDVHAGDEIGIANGDASTLLYVVATDANAHDALVRLSGARLVNGSLRAHVPVDGRLLFGARPHTPKSVEPVAADDFATGAADVVVIAAHDLLDGARALAAAHRARGLVDRVVDVESVFDQFAGGAHDPRAIPRFLLAAKQTWTTPPKFVVFVGDGDLDYRDVIHGAHEAQNRVPPMLLRTDEEGGLVAADALLADVDGDGVADFAFGRIPAHENADVTAYIARAQAFAGPERALFAADVDDQDGHFAESAAGLAQQLSIPVATVAVENDDDIDAARATLFAQVPDADLFTFVGHGGVDRMARDGLVTTSDAPAFTAAKPTAIVALTCFINRFETRVIDSLGETLVRDGGAIAVIAPSGLGNHGRADELGTHMTARLRSGGPIGAILVDAERSYVASGGSVALVSAENLLGDPTVPLAPEPGAPSCASTTPAPIGLALLLLSFLRRRRRA